MLLLRIGKRGRWQGAGSVAEQAAQAVKDLTLRDGEEGLSVFEVSSEDEARELAVVFGPVCRRLPDDVDYIIFDSACVDAVEGLSVVVTAGPSYPALRDSHREVRGITAASRDALARSILEAKPTVVRIRRNDAVSAAKAAAEEDPLLLAAAKPGWKLND